MVLKYFEIAVAGTDFFFFNNENADIDKPAILVRMLYTLKISRRGDNILVIALLEIVIKTFLTVIHTYTIHHLYKIDLLC